jgi:hypothetical protein
MQFALGVIDNFFPDAAQVRAFALKHDFSVANEMDGHKYPGTAMFKHPQFQPYLAGLMSAAIGHQVEINVSAFVLAKDGEFTEQWIHADSNCARFAAVIYLFDDHHEHGTAFWRHKEADEIEMAQPFYDALKVDVSDEAQVEALVAKLKADGEDESKWQMAGFSEARMNRMIYFNSKLFHSRYPRHAFGDSPETGRLITVVFFDIAP